MSKSMKFQVLLCCVVLLLCGFSSSEKPKATEGTVTIKFNHLFKNEALDFEKEYTNTHGEKIKFTLLNYFISNIKLTKEDGSTYSIPQDSSYFLVKQTDQASKEITLNHIPSGKYSALTFTIGVDSLRNTMGIGRRTGALDVGATAKGMYWVWNSGYIFFKLEGTSPAAPEKQRNVFNYHVGGFGGYKSKTLNNIKTRTLDFKPLMVSDKKNPVIEINVEIDHFFDQVNPIKIAEKSSVMWGEFSTKISENYVSIFNLGNVSSK
jgi:hypothetical protein